MNGRDIIQIETKTPSINVSGYKALTFEASLAEILPLWFLMAHYLSNFEIFFDHLLTALRWKLWPLSLHGVSSLYIMIYSPQTYFSYEKYFRLARSRSPNGPHLFRVVPPIRLLENPGTTVVCIEYWTPWLENSGYHTQVWDNIHYRTCVTMLYLIDSA